MSNRRRRSKAAVKHIGNTTTASQPNALPTKQQQSSSNLSALFTLVAQNQMAADGYANPAAFLGEDSPVLASGSYRRSYISQNWELLTVMYRESWLAMRIIDTPVEDTTRAWYKLQTSLDDEDIMDMRRLEARHSVKQEIANAIRWARLYGGSIALIVIKGQNDQLDQPLDLDSIAPGDFQGLLVMDRSQGIEPSLELEPNIEDPDFGYPMYYNVSFNLEDQQQARIHHSRVLRFVGRELPRMETINENYWGAPEMEHIFDELQKRNATSANIAQLVFQANVTTLKMADFGEALALGTDDQRANIINAIAQENRFRTSFGLQLLSKDDAMENHPYSFAGLSDIYEQFMMDISGAAEIPATKLFGRSPQGFNSTGESDMRNYYDLIAQMQERILRPALEKLVPIMALSCWGFVPDDLEIIFEPAEAITPKDRAELISKISNPIIEAFKAGLITRCEAIAELKNMGAEYGIWSKLPDDPKDGDHYADDPDDDDEDSDDDSLDDLDDDESEPQPHGGGGEQTIAPAASQQQVGIVSSIDKADAPR